jgi:GT2 family glycosyltransferase
VAWSPPKVYAIIPAFGGPALLAQALGSLATERPALCGAIVVNNARDPAIECVAKEATVPTTVFTPPCNLGTAGGLAAGLREFIALSEATHAWILDDDAVATPGALAAMLAAMRATGADAAAPLIADGFGRVRWIPCRSWGRRRSALRRGLTRDQFLCEFGDTPRRWNWAIWASVIISRRAIEAVGFPRLELWSQFSDIEYMLRITQRFAGVLVPRAVCQHLPPVSSGGSFDAKLYAALQNGSYVALRLSHGRRALQHLPGQIFRYLRHYRWAPRAWRKAMLAFWEGAVLGRPSGRTMQRAEFAQAELAWMETTRPPAESRP